MKRNSNNEALEYTGLPSIPEWMRPAPELVLGKRISLDNWLAGRRRRRELSDLVSPEECGKDTSDDDLILRATFNGRRNDPFTPTEELPGVSLYDQVDEPPP